MSRIAWSVGFALIGLGLGQFAEAHPTDIKPQFADTSATTLVLHRDVDSDDMIAAAAQSDDVYFTRRSVSFETMTFKPDPAKAPAIAAPVLNAIAAPAPAASGFFANMFNEVPQPGVLAMVAIGAALCRFGSSFLKIRR